MNKMMPAVLAGNDSAFGLRQQTIVSGAESRTRAHGGKIFCEAAGGPVSYCFGDRDYASRLHGFSGIAVIQPRRQATSRAKLRPIARPAGIPGCGGSPQ